MNDGPRYVAMTDGGSRGNPGPAGYGAVLVDTQAELVLAERAEYIGIESNNVAEYRGLIAALEAALELGVEELEVRMDSKLVVEQMSGRWKIKHPGMQTLALQAKRLADQLDRVEYVWIPRAQNSHADRLANEAMDGGGKGDVRRAAPPEQRDEPADNTPETLVTSHPGPPPSLSLILLRHGETEQSLQRRFSGSSDLPLTDKGEAQAGAVAQRIAGTPPIAAIYASPLQRARQTAEAVSSVIGVPVTIEAQLREIDFGDWEGLTFAEAQRIGGAEFDRWREHTDVAPPGGESQAKCLERVAAFRNELLERHKYERILIVTHVTPIKSLLGEALGGLKIASRINLDLCSLSRIDYHRGRTVVKLVNEISHLGDI
ncbi:bifunctional RNase H/acid phosphatase [Cumulibacter soli]|uniref:bifunctional RNase H/acid phosphatase n=1 Tax=Cumulibacter soli TaxID=2546344 RepID=UPI001FB8CF39|nr:bifunctional RNase H/acid phosphatase [Cumulibacter soli]